MKSEQEDAENTEALAVFTFGGHEIRVAGTKEAPQFCAADICDALELGNSRQAVANHPEDEKGVTSFDTPGGRDEACAL